MDARRFEAIVVGSGFAGAVTACRLAQAGVDVCIIERGRRYEADDFPEIPLKRRREKAPGEQVAESYEPPRDFARWLWPVDQGLWDVRDLGEVISIQAAGYGGGSLVYANVHLRAPAEVFTDGQWPASYTRAALDPYYDLAGLHARRASVSAKGSQARENGQAARSGRPKRREPELVSAAARGQLRQRRGDQPLGQGAGEVRLARLLLPRLWRAGQEHARLELSCHRRAAQEREAGHDHHARGGREDRADSRRAVSLQAHLLRSSRARPSRGPGAVCVLVRRSAEHDGAAAREQSVGLSGRGTAKLRLLCKRRLARGRLRLQRCTRSGSRADDHVVAAVPDRERVVPRSRRRSAERARCGPRRIS